MFGKKLSLVLAIFQASGIVLGQCSQVYQRKEIRQLSSSELTAFFNAVNQLKSGPAPTRYDSFVRTHTSYASEAHGVPAFLAWHRIFLKQFEQALQSVDPSVSLPYWNWAYDSQAPELSGIFSSNYFGGDGGANGCVTTGRFAGWNKYYNEGGQASVQCLTRNFNAGGGRISAFYSPEAVQSILQSSTTFDQLRQGIENAPHGVVHNGIGGDMQTMGSCNDPLFWVHHSFIDKLYNDWQVSHPSVANTYGGTDANNRRVSDSDNMSPFNVQVSSAYSISSLCYNYVQDGVDVTNPPPVTTTSTTSSSTTTTSSSSSATTTPTSSGSSSSSPSGSSSSTTTGSSSSSTTGPSSSSTTGSSSSSSSGSTSSGGPSNTGSTSTSSSSTSGSATTTSVGSYPTENLPIYNGQVHINVTLPSLPSYNVSYPVDVLSPADRSSPYKLRLPLPLPVHWLEMNRISVQSVRSQETNLASVISVYNKIGFQSVACLAKRPDLSSHIKNIQIPIISVPKLTPLFGAHPDYVPGKITYPGNNNGNNYGNGTGSNNGNNGGNHGNGKENNGHHGNGNYSTKPVSHKPSKPTTTSTDCDTSTSTIVYKPTTNSSSDCDTKTSTIIYKPTTTSSTDCDTLTSTSTYRLKYPKWPKPTSASQYHY